MRVLWLVIKSSLATHSVNSAFSFEHSLGLCTGPSKLTQRFIQLFSKGLHSWAHSQEGELLFQWISLSIWMPSGWNMVPANGRLLLKNSFVFCHSEAQTLGLWIHSPQETPFLLTAVGGEFCEFIYPLVKPTHWGCPLTSTTISQLPFSFQMNVHTTNLQNRSFYCPSMITTIIQFATKAALTCQLLYCPPVAHNPYVLVYWNRWNNTFVWGLGAV